MTLPKSGWAWLARHLRAAQAAAPKVAGFVQLLDSVITETQDVIGASCARSPAACTRPCYPTAACTRH